MNMNLRIYLFINPPITWSAFASKSVCTTVAWVTFMWGRKFVDEVRSTVVHRSLGSVLAAAYTITEAYRPGNFTIFHWRMSTITMYHIWMLAHALLAFSFLQLPQNDTIPEGVLCRRNHYQWVFRNCSFYWLHLGSCNYHSVQLQS